MPKPMPEIINENAPDLSTDHAWEEWGRRDPYFGVITDPRFRRLEITELSKREFFESGSNHVNYVMQTIQRIIAPDFVPRTVLDFGCGVGRTLIPFAKIAQRVVGADVSESMLQEARRNCDADQLTNVNLMVSDDSVSSIADEFDLVHSFIVFQHIPPERGRLIFRNLLDRIAPAGVAAIHVLYSKIHYADTFGIAPTSISSAPGQPVSQQAQSVEPEMQMNPYLMNEIFFFMQSKGVQRFYSEFSDHGGELGLFIFFQMP
jgi:2-polyprenyl-3-methyl-5-hydroxy-6-metoxy-1,4-benzoquinol methylase